jgi:hypothetical protein
MNMNGKRSKTGYIGVYYSNKRIIAQVTINSKSVHVGYFKTLKEASEARDKEIIKYFGEYANLNNK